MKMEGIIITVLSCISLSIMNAEAKTITVSGADIQQAVNSAVSGDVIIVKPGIYHEKVSIENKTGIILQADHVGNVIIDGTGLSIPSGDSQLVLIKNSNNITVRGLEICNYKTNSASSFIKGIGVEGNGSDITVTNNKIYNIENINKDGGANGIGVYGTDSSKSINNIVIDNNEVHDCKLALSESVVLNGNVEKFKVTNNHIHHNNNIGIDFIGYEGTAKGGRARDGVCSGNYVHDITSAINPSYNGERSAGGIYVDGGTRITIQNNKVEASDIGIELASEHKGKDTSDCIATGNTISNCMVGISIGGYDSKRGNTRDCTIQNNTIQNNSGGQVVLQYYCYNNNITNNTLIGYQDFTPVSPETCSGNITSPNTIQGTKLHNDPQK